MPKRVQIQALSFYELPESSKDKAIAAYMKYNEISTCEEDINWIYVDKYDWFDDISKKTSEWKCPLTSFNLTANYVKLYKESFHSQTIEQICDTILEVEIESSIIPHATIFKCKRSFLDKNSKEYQDAQNEFRARLSECVLNMLKAKYKLLNSREEVIKAIEADYLFITDNITINKKKHLFI